MRARHHDFIAGDQILELVEKGFVVVDDAMGGFDPAGREIDAACGQLHAQLAGRTLREARAAAALPA